MWIDSVQQSKVLEISGLIDALAAADRSAFVVPERLHHDVACGEFLAMPAYSASYLGLKIVTVSPRNAGSAIPTVQASYQLFSARTGALLAIMDGTALTLWRTAGVAALAAGRLASRSPDHILIVGTGALAPFLVTAFATSFPDAAIALWGRRFEAAEAAARAAGRRAAAIRELEVACRQADIICCATSSTQPLVRGDWLKDGAHLSLNGGFTPSMHEADSGAFRDALVAVDTNAAMRTAGELLAALRAGSVRKADVITLQSLLAEERSGPEIPRRTVFKSVGSAENDLIAAEYLWRRMALSSA
jgi:Predicted ornithine cyclodeaminase, mu-crystallin homolog